MPLVPSRGLYLYLEILKVAFEDAIVTDDEAQILHVLSRCLGVAPADTAECRSVVILGEVPLAVSKEDDSLSADTIWATSPPTSPLSSPPLDDDVISEDEWAMLDHLRQTIGVQEDQHALIEEAIRAMSEIDAQGRRRIERLERFITVCPYR